MTSIAFGSGRASESRTLSCVGRADLSQTERFMSRPAALGTSFLSRSLGIRNSVDVFVLIWSNYQCLATPLGFPDALSLVK